MSNNSGHLKICLITFPLPEIQGGHILVENFLRVLEALAEEIYLVSGNYPQSAAFSSKIHLRNIKHDSKKQSMMLRVPKYVMTQLKLSYNLAKVANKADIVVFFIAGALFLPMLTGKLFRKKTILIATGSGTESGKQIYKNSLLGIGTFLFPRILSTVENLNYRLVDRIVVYSPSLIDYIGLQNHIHKISIAHRHFLGFSKFKMWAPLKERGNLVGYIGRLSQEKGILNFIQAIPRVLEVRGNATFLLGGDGQLRTRVEQYLSAQSLNSKVNFVGWIPHDELPKYLNELKLLVLPSYTEGLPNIMLEAMSCGTPVLATPVGAIPDVIKDNETGFIMEDNSPECIARNVIRALNHPIPEEIIKNARALIEREFTYEAAKEMYTSILERT